MTLHDDEVRLRHMLDYSRKALELVKDRSRSDLDDDRVLELALVRLFQSCCKARAPEMLVSPLNFRSDPSLISR